MWTPQAPSLQGHAARAARPATCPRAVLVYLAALAALATLAGCGQGAPVHQEGSATSGLTAPSLSSTAEAAILPGARPTRVGGRVVAAEDGSPLAGATVWIAAWERDDAAGGGALAGGRKVSVRLASDQDGNFAGELPGSWPRGGSLAVIVQARGRSEWGPWNKAADPDAEVAPFQPGDDVTRIVRMISGPTLAGVVTDEAGAPVPGARIGVTISNGRGCNAPHAYALGDLHWPHDATSGADGRWELLTFPVELTQGDEAEGYHLSLDVDRDGYAPAIVESLDARAPADGVFDVPVVLQRGVSVKGRVVDERGGPAGQARIRAEAFYECGTFTRTAAVDAAGAFELAGLDRRAWHVVAERAGSASSRKEKLVVDGLGRGRTAPFELRLRRGAGVEGRIAAAGGRPLAGLDLTLQSDALAWRGRATTDEHGAFRFDDVPHGDLTLSSPELPKEQVRVPGPRLDLRLPARRELIVRVVAAEDHHPLTKGRVSVRAPSAVWGRDIDGDDGRVSLGQVVPQPLEVSADVPGRALATNDVTVPGDARGPFETTIEVPLGFNLLGQVRDEAGSPIEGARVRAWGLRDEFREARSDARGLFVLRGLSAGHLVVGSGYAYCANAPGFAPWAGVSLYARMAFDRRADVVLERGATVRGRVLDRERRPLAGVAVRANPVVRFLWMKRSAPCISPSTVTDVEGRYVLEHVPKGEVVVRIGSKGGGAVHTIDRDDQVVGDTIHD